MSSLCLLSCALFLSCRYEEEQLLPQMNQSSKGPHTKNETNEEEQERQEGEKKNERDVCLILLKKKILYSEGIRLPS